MPVETDLWDAVLSGQRETARDVFKYFAAWVPIDAPLDQVRGCEKSRNAAPKWTLSVSGFRTLERGRQPTEIFLGRVARIRPEGTCRSRIALHIRLGEQLDLVGLVKRLELGDDAIRFPWVSRFAGQPMDSGRMHDHQAIKSLREDRSDSSRNFAGSNCSESGGTFLTRPRKTIRQSFLGGTIPFEGSPLFISRHRELMRQHPAFEPDFKPRPG